MIVQKKPMDCPLAFLLVSKIYRNVKNALVLKEGDKGKFLGVLAFIRKVYCIQEA